MTAHDSGATQLFGLCEFETEGAAKLGTNESPIFFSSSSRSCRSSLNLPGTFSFSNSSLLLMSSSGEIPVLDREDDGLKLIGEPGRVEIVDELDSLLGGDAEDKSVSIGEVELGL